MIRIPRLSRQTVLAPRLPLSRCGLGMLGAVSLLCSCGGSTSAGPSQAQFASRANAICAVALKRAALLKSPMSQAELLSFSEQADSIVSKTVSELKGLVPPASSQAAYARFLAATGHEAAMLGELATALRNGRAARARAVLKALNSEASNEEGKALGLSECARTVKAR